MSRSRLLHGAAAAALVAATLAPGDARANGRYPQTMSVHTQPGAGPAGRIAVGATFGLLLSDDDGDTWRWTCEQSIGYGGDFDPVYAISGAGVLYATTFDGLSISRDGGCSWAYAGGPLAGLWASDVHIAKDGAVWVSTSSGGMPNDVFVSTDDGLGFASTALFTDRAWWKSVRVAPSDPKRIYVSGYQLDDPGADAGDGIPAPLLRRSDDGGLPPDQGGKGWLDIPFAFENESQLRILGVDPTNPDTVFARVDGALKDTLLRSTDGAMSWTPVLQFDGDGADLVAFTIRDDGQHLIAGTVSFGVKVSEDGGLTWKDPAQSPKMTCLGERSSDDTLFACGANWNPDRFALGRSTDGQTWTKVVRFVELDDELLCPAGSGHAEKCSPLWPDIKTQFGIGAPDAGPDGPDGGDAAPDAGTGPRSKGDCGGCGVALASVLLVPPWRRRRRAR